MAYGHQEVGAAEELHTRADSSVVETDVDWPTDVRLLWDAIQCVVLLITHAASRHGIAGWHKYRSWLRAVHAHFAPVRLARRWRTKEGVQAYLEICQVVVKKVKSTVQTLQQQSVPHPEVTRYLMHCERQIEQVERRLIHEERIPRHNPPTTLHCTFAIHHQFCQPFLFHDAVPVQSCISFHNTLPTYSPFSIYRRPPYAKNQTLTLEQT